MPPVDFHSLCASHDSVQDRVVVLTGGADGIGKFMVRHFFKLGANIVFGDINAEAGAAYAESFTSRKVRFVKTDISQYQDNVRLFKEALQAFGRVDHAFGIAGIIEVGAMFPEPATLEAVEKPHNMKCLDLDLDAQLSFARVATAYLAHDRREGDPKSLVLISSSAGLVEYAGIPVYSTAKHGIIGLVRALRETHPAQHGIRVHAVAPCPTKTSMIDGREEAWRRIGMPICTTLDIARIFQACAVGRTPAGELLNGCEVFASGDRAVEVAAGLEATKKEWLGEFMMDSVRKAKEAIGVFKFED